MAISQTADGTRILDDGHAAYELPRDSADLYRRAGHLGAIWGDDFFFVAGTATLPEARTGEPFALIGDCDFILSKRIAVNLDPPAGTAAQEAARACFRAYREFHSASFPLRDEIRAQENEGAGLKLLSGGAYVFVLHDNDIRLALFKRTDKIGLWTEPAGLVAESATAQKEALEELTLVEVAPDGQVIIHIADFAAATLKDRDYEKLKRAQLPIICKNLATHGITASELLWRRAGLEPFDPLPRHVITLKASDGAVVDRLHGVISFEHEYNTLGYRLAGLCSIDNDHSRLMLIDGEPFDRPGKLYRRDELPALIASGQALAETAFMAGKFLENWPQPTLPARGKPRFRAAPDF